MTPAGGGVPPATGAGTVVRVLPDVASIDKPFDYLAPARWASLTAVGSLVRVDLAGRRIGGWIVAIDVEPPEGVAVRPLSHVRGFGPDAGIVELATWAAWRWAGRRSSVLASASPGRAVTRLPHARLGHPHPPPSTPVALDDLPVDTVTVVRLGPATDLTPIAAGLAQRGPLLVVVPSKRRAAVLTARLRRAGADVAEVPEQWAQARAGAAVVVGSRAAAWAPCPGMAAALVVDGHDESLVQGQAPTWSAVAVVAERCRRAGVPCVVTSPSPTLELLAGASVRVASPTEERHRWAPVEIVDRRDGDPRLGLWSERVATVVRSEGRVLAVLNRSGRARLLACSSCGTLARCERCWGALGEDDDGLRCGRCGLGRPVVCAACGSTAMRRLQLGVGRAREQLEALVGAPVGEVTASTAAVPDTRVVIGTEAVLHRVERADAVVFLDVDQHLLAARYRAGEQALALLARASRLVGGRRPGAGRIVVQTRMPDHPALRAAITGDPSILADAERPVRQALRLPPAAAVATVSGAAGGAYAAALQEVLRGPGAGPGAGAAVPPGARPLTRRVEVLGPDGERWVVRAPDSAALSDVLASVERPPGRLRIDVDPIDL